jgi:hypothetical protein
MKKRLLKLASLASLILSSQGAYGFSQTNFSLPHEGYLWTSSKYLLPDYYDKGDPKAFRLSVGSIVEYGFDCQGANKNNLKVGPYQIYYPTENLLQAELSAASQIKVTALSNMNLIGGANNSSTAADSGIRFAMDDNVNVKEWDLTLWSRLALPIDAMPGQLELAAYCPIKSFDITNVNWNLVNASNPNVPPVGAISLMTQAELAELFAGSSPEQRSWSENGIGDVNVFLSWKNHYTQVNDALSSVGIYAQVGLSLPTSKKLNITTPLAIPFGYDGAMAMPISAAINLNFSKNIRLCGSVDAVIGFKEEQERLTRNNESQGSLWLKDRVLVARTPGVIFGLNLLAEAISNCKNYSMGMAYSFVKKSADELSSSNEKFNGSIANKSEMALEKSFHNLTFRAGVDLREMVDSTFAPTLSVSYKYPLRGQRVMLFKTLKIEASISF